MRYFLFVAVLVTLTSAQTTPAPLINNPSGRTNISLNGAWHIIIDPLESGLEAQYYKNRKPKDRSDLVEYDFDSSETLNVPGDWNTQKEKLHFYEGPVWYEKSFAYKKRAHTRAFVYFGAVNSLARVYLNGQKLGEHEGGFTPFNFEITSLLKDGDNFLVVEADDTRRPDAVPSLRTDWWNYGGMTRDVLLVETPEIFVRDYWIQSAKRSANEIAGWAQLDGDQRAGQQVVVEIPEAGWKHAVTADATGRAEFHFPASLQLWSPENPKLYDVAVSSGGETVHDRIGFRTIETRGTQILLNGKPVFLRGISIHEEAPLRGGRAYSEEDAQTLFGWAKDLGCNFVRLAHYPHNENEIRMADRMGLLVWSEIPVYWDISWKNPATLTNAQQQLRESIARDHNRASVIFWSLSNETPVKPERTEFLRRLADQARELDSTRLITSALNHVDDDGPDRRVLNDPAGKFLDVLGLNEYFGWYYGRPEDADRQQWSSKFDKPLIVSEFGGEAPQGRHGDSAARWTEEYQSNLFVHQLTMVDKIPGLAGLSPWLLVDFRSPRRPLPGIQDYFNRKGLLSDKGQRKQAFFVLQKYYREKEEHTRTDTTKK
ncbi:MAG: beta-glucuronidase [Acidobacteria bacterium]|nr:beta-glucuronidase [Acidobacteriota bacterium]